MSWFVDSSQTSEHELEMPGTGEKATVKLRQLNAGDVAALNELKMSESGASLALGEVKLLAIELAVVEWSLPLPATRDTIRQLNPMVAEQLSRIIDVTGGANGTGPPEAARAADEPKEPAEQT